MSCFDVRLAVLASPDRARSLFTVRAAISSARSVLSPRCLALSLMCSYCRSRFGLDPLGMSATFRHWRSHSTGARAHRGWHLYPGRPGPFGRATQRRLVGFAQPREHLPGVELEEALHLAADLADVDLVEPGVGVGPHGAEMSVRIGPARRGDHVFGDELGDLAEVPGQGEQLGGLTRNGVGRAKPVPRLAGL